MAASAPAGLVQALFERELGPPLELPQASSAALSAAGADCRQVGDAMLHCHRLATAAPASARCSACFLSLPAPPPAHAPHLLAAALLPCCRELQKLRFRVVRGLTLDYQGVPATGTLVGLTYRPPRPAPRRTPQPQLPAAPASLSNGSSTSAAAESNGASLDSAASAALRPPPQPQRQAVHPQPAHATLWALVQPAAGVGVHTALSAVDAGPTGFGGWHQAGFLDVSRRVGVDYSLSRHPASGLTADLQLSAT